MLLLFAPLGCALLLGLSGPRPAPAEATDPVRKLEVWVQRLQRFRSGNEEERLEELRVLLDDVDLRRLAQTGAELDPAAVLAVLDVAAHGWLPRPERRAFRGLLRSPQGRPAEGGAASGGFSQRVSLIGVDRLERWLDIDRKGELALMLAMDVLFQPREHGIERRRAACDALFGRRLDATQAALFACARDDDDHLREAAFRALSGWDQPGVHRFLFRELDRGRVSLPIAIAHLEAVERPLGPESIDLLSRRIQAYFASEDWRDAIRGARLAGALGGEVTAPLLIEALALWNTRREVGDGSLRVIDSIHRGLRELSGRSIPPEADRWRTWWRAVEDGRVELPTGVEGAQAVTRAGFFGLNPVSERVVFLIDRSRSMTAGFGTAGQSRYESAVEELLGFATKLGADTRFGVTLFHSGAERWRARLTPADEGGVKAARRWLRAKTPSGGTELFAGLAAALDLDREGRLGARRIEADTVIILCDGDTAEGPFWVEPWLERVNEEAQLVFHCVQVGGRGDGTLELLAERTGGDFVRIGG